MHRDVKRAIAVEAVPALFSILAPAARVAVSRHYDSKMLDKRQEHAVEVARLRSEKLDAAAEVGKKRREETARSGRYNPAGTTDMTEDDTPETTDQPIESEDPYDALREIQDSTNCGFCYSAAEALLDEDEGTALAGLEELREYERVKQEMEGSSADVEEIEAAVGEVVSGWDVIPRVAT